MTEPSERDIKAAADWAGDKPRAFTLALAWFRAAARAEERERIVQAMLNADEMGYVTEQQARFVADTIRGGQ